MPMEVTLLLRQSVRAETHTMLDDSNTRSIVSYVRLLSFIMPADRLAYIRSYEDSAHSVASGWASRASRASRVIVLS